MSYVFSTEEFRELLEDLARIFCKSESIRRWFAFKVALTKSTDYQELARDFPDMLGDRRTIGLLSNLFGLRIRESLVELAHELPGIFGVLHSYVSDTAKAMMIREPVIEFVTGCELINAIWLFLLEAIIIGSRAWGETQPRIARYIAELVYSISDDTVKRTLKLMHKHTKRYRGHPVCQKIVARELGTRESAIEDMFKRTIEFLYALPLPIIRAERTTQQCTEEEPQEHLHYFFVMELEPVVEELLKLIGAEA